MSARGGKRKGSKKNYYQQSAKKAKGGDGGFVVENLTENLRGFLVTCNNNEYQCLKESYNLLNEAADRVYGPYRKDPEADAVADDIEASIAAEVATLKSSSERRFIQVKTKCNNVLFVRTNDPQVEPNGLARDIIEEIRRRRQANCRYIQRFVPVLGTFKATEPDKFEAHFKDIFGRTATKAVRSFSVIAKVRNNTGFNSESALRVKMVDLIRAERPNWLLNHSEPNTMVAVNICQRAGCISILDDFNELSKYNLIEFGKKCADELKPKAEKTEADAPTISETTESEQIKSETPDQTSSSSDIKREPADSSETPESVEIKSETPDQTLDIKSEPVVDNIESSNGAAPLEQPDSQQTVEEEPAACT